MSLNAVVDGKTITGPDLSDEEWATLKLRHKKGLAVSMGCCGAPGHLRVSKNGTRHFYHAVDTGCRYAEESREHLEIKYRVYRMCQAEGWDASVEFPAPDRTWISDVYATGHGRKIVFEIQISPLSPAELEERDRKYRNEGIESYWLLDNFLGRSSDFEAWYHAHLYGEDVRCGQTIPYIDPSLFATGTENHLFIARGIRSAGLRVKKQTLFTTNNPEISLDVWVREVLKGNYRNYLEEVSAVYHEKRRLKNLAAPALIRFSDCYRKIIPGQTYRKQAGHYDRIFNGGKEEVKAKAAQKKFQDILSELDWLENEYRLFIAESYGLFSWKKQPGQDTPRPFFRLESEVKIRKLQDCVGVLSRWEESFSAALGSLKREFPADAKK